MGKFKDSLINESKGENKYSKENAQIICDEIKKLRKDGFSDDEIYDKINVKDILKNNGKI